MKTHVSSGKAVKADGKNLYMLAKGIMPSDVGAKQAVVDALAAYGVIARYDIGKDTHVAPVG